MIERQDHSSLLRQLTAQTRDLARKHRRLMSRGTAGLQKGNAPAVRDLVFESGLVRVKGLIPCALTGLFRLKQPRIRLSESLPRDAFPVPTSRGRKNVSLNITVSKLSKTIGKGKPGDMQRKEKLYGRLDALATPRRSSVFDCFSLTSGRFMATML
jgi:hypothetical protein